MTNISRLKFLFSGILNIASFSSAAEREEKNVDLAEYFIYVENDISRAFEKLKKNYERNQEIF